MRWMRWVCTTSLICAWSCGGHPGDFEADAVPETATQVSALNQFTDIATVCDDSGNCASPCSTSDYSQILNCYNQTLPEPPSITRRLELTDDNDSAVRNYPDGAFGAGKTQILPYTHSTVDGRIVSTGRGIPKIASYRPQSMGYDEALGSDNPFSGSRHLHWPVWIPALDYQSAINFNTAGSVPTYHWVLCEDSSQAASTSQTNANGRNPRPCTAQHDTGDPVLDGDCYDVEPMFMIEQGGQWEMRSNPLTLFVPDPKTGYSGTPWVYPRRNTSNLGLYVDWRFNNSFVNPVAPGWSTFRPKGRSECYPCEGQQTAQDCQDEYQECLDEFNEFNDPHGDRICNLMLTSCLANACTPPPTTPKWCAFYYNQRRKVVSHQLFEPSVTADGRLLIVNGLGDGLMYSYNQYGACRADGFQTFKHLSEMPSDPQVNQRYDLAKGGSFRDTIGTPIPAGQIMRGAYLWVDRLGKNVVWSPMNQARDAYRDNAGNFMDGRPGKQISVLGAWTQYRQVVMDNQMNMTDFGGVPGLDGATYTMRLYDGVDEVLRPKSVIDLFSFENVHNHYDALSPDQPFDVVWRLSADNQQNAEVVFDEYLRNDAVVVAHMNAPLRYETQSNGSKYPYPWDGFRADYPNKSFRDDRPVPNENAIRPYFHFAETPRLQNAATSRSDIDPSAPNIPSTLELRGGARVEPVAQGGVIGKGLWLDGLNDHVRASWWGTSHPEVMTSVWVDSRAFNDSELRTVFHFSDNSYIALSNDKIAALTPSSSVPNEIDISGLGLSRGAWFHLAVKITRSGGQTRLRFFIDGTPLAQTINVGGTRFLLGAAQWSIYRFGSFYLGDPGPSLGISYICSNGTCQSRKTFRGWLDEWRVYVMDADERQDGSYFDEFICNQAQGSLVRVRDSNDLAISLALAPLGTIAEEHGLVGASQSRPGGVNVCEQLRLTSYTEPRDLPRQRGHNFCADRVHRNPHSSTIVADHCAREDELEVASLPLTPNNPRPNFSSLEFCKSCHLSGAKIDGLKPAALTYDSSTVRKDDARRQPMDWPAREFGYSVDQPPLPPTPVAPASGMALDEYFDLFSKIVP